MIEATGRLLDQYKLLGAVIDTKWATGLDHKVARHVIDRYYQKYGQGRASLRYLEEKTGSRRNKIIPSIRRLVEHGVLAVARLGSGTRATEYSLNFEFAKTSGTPEGTSTSGPPEGTSAGANQGTATPPSGTLEGTESYLRDRSTDRSTVSRTEGAPAAATPPPVDDLTVVPADTAVGPKGASSSFDELWSAYPRKHDRSKARAAYDKLAPTPELHARLITAATALASHYQASGTEQKWRKHLHNWLAEERYLEDIPVPYQPAQDAAKAHTKLTGQRNILGPSVDTAGLIGRPPIGCHQVEIINSDIEPAVPGADSHLMFGFRITDGRYTGKEFRHRFPIVSSDLEAQAMGQSVFSSIRNATNIDNPSDTSEFQGAMLTAVVKPGRQIEYVSM